MQEALLLQLRERNEQTGLNPSENQKIEYNIYEELRKV